MDLEVQRLAHWRLQLLKRLKLLGADEACEAGSVAVFDPTRRPARSHRFERFDLLHPQREFCCGCARHVCRDDAFLLRLEFTAYVADQTAVHRPVAARG